MEGQPIRGRGQRAALRLALLLRPGHRAEQGLPDRGRKPLPGALCGDSSASDPLPAVLWWMEAQPAALHWALRDAQARQHRLGGWGGDGTAFLPGALSPESHTALLQGPHLRWMPYVLCSTRWPGCPRMRDFQGYDQ